MISDVFLEHFASYQTGKVLPRGFSCAAVDERESTVLYSWDNGDCWLLTQPGEVFDTECVRDLAGFLAANPDFRIVDTVNLYVLLSGAGKTAFALPDGYTGRLLNSDDKPAFDAFHAACPGEDKEAGQVALDDDLVYGVFYGAQLVAVASLWHWGDYIADIGVLTHPGFRRKGLMKVAVQSIAANTGRSLLWRADVENTGSNMTATGNGFQPVGSVVSIRCREST